MCRWLAYQGPPLALETLLLRPENALVRQSMAARRSLTPVNGDGFGVAWWGAKPKPGVFRDTAPAWNDGNRLSLSEQIEARQFFAHVRASTGTATSRANCHPFAIGLDAFMHNGAIGGWSKVRRSVEQLIPDDLYVHRQGATDTEALFLLALALGLSENPKAAMARAVGKTVAAMQAADISAPFRMTAAYGDGKRMVAVRWSSDNQSPSLYYARGAGVACDDGRLAMQPGRGAAVVLSEPLDGSEEWWTAVPEASLLTIENGDVTVEPFAPVR